MKIKAIKERDMRLNVFITFYKARKRYINLFLCKFVFSQSKMHGYHEKYIQHILKNESLQTGR